MEFADRLGYNFQLTPWRGIERFVSCHAELYFLAHRIPGLKMNIKLQFLARGQKLSLAVASILFLAGTGRAFGAEANADLKYLPDGCDVVVTADVSGMISSSAGQKIKEGAADIIAMAKSKMPKDSKIQPEDVGRVTFGLEVQGKKGAGVMHMTRAVSEKDFPDAEKATKKTVGQHQIYVQNGGGFCLIDDRTIAMGDEESLGKVLERDAPAKLGDDLKAAMGDVDFTKSFAVAMAMKNLLGAAGPAAAGADGIRTLGMQADVGSNIKLKAVATCKDGPTADQMKQVADGMLAGMKANSAQLPPDAAKLLSALEVSKSGSSIVAGLTVEAETIVNLAKLAAKGRAGE